MKESKEHIRDIKYKDDSLLRARKEFYDLAAPFISLEDEVIKRLEQFNYSPPRILDVGCGNGDLLLKIHDKHPDWNLTGIDFAEGMVQNNKDVNFQVADVEDLPFEDNSFDFILAKTVFHLVENVQQGIDEIYRCLKPGGKFILVLHSKRNKPMLKLIQKELNKKFRKTIKHTDKNVTLEDVEQYLKKFTIIQKDLLENTTELKESQPYIKYFSSLKWSWVPKITEEQWEDGLKLVKELVDKEIEEKGHLTEVNSNGIVVAEK